MGQAGTRARRRGLAIAVALAAAAAAVVGSCAASPSPPATAGSLSWQKWQHLGGVFDLGLQADGAGLIAAGSEKLNKVDVNGGFSPITGAGAYANSGGFEAYFAVSNGEPVNGSCRFQHGAIYVIGQKPAGQVLEVDPNSGRPKLFASVGGVDSLNGIAFDTSGSFGEHPLLVTGPSGGHSVVAAIDCHGVVTLVTRNAPRLEGGVAVAPAGFGHHGGELVAPDEISGGIIGIRADGTTATLAGYKQLVGGDLGVESAGFVPSAFLTTGGFAYLADRATSNNPHPGTDSILRLASADLARAGVHEGDLLVATEGGGLTVDVSCAASCSVREVASGPPPGHIEGHLVFLSSRPAPGASGSSPAPAPSPSPAAAKDVKSGNNTAVGAALAGAGGLVLLLALLLLVRRRAAG